VPTNGMRNLVKLSTEDTVGIITIDNPPVNALSSDVCEEIERCLDAVTFNPALKATILIGAGRSFVAGADINELANANESGQTLVGKLGQLLGKLENLNKPVVAALHGTALGGGLELAMAAHYRLASPGTKLGQPEVNLGLIPGGQGTQRLPRLIGLAKAVEMCISGAPIDACEAKDLGLVDRMIDGDLLSGAIVFAKEISARGDAHPKTSELRTKLGTPSENALILEAGRQQAAKLRRNMFAPLAALEALEAATVLPFEEGCKKEAELFEQCLASSQAKALIHAFLGEREVAKVPDIPSDTPALPIKKVGVVGAGTMGSGIAMAFANSGFAVLLKEVDPVALERAMARIRKNYESSAKRGRITTEEMARRLALIQPRSNNDGLEGSDLIIEAVFESLELKKQIFAELEKVAKPECVLATNTSVLNIDTIAQSTSRPDMVVGLHFFNPANVMRLLEIVRGKHTSRRVIATALSLAKSLHKVGIVVGNCFGFVGNRMLLPYIREAIFLLQEGATPEHVDRVLYDWGIAMGIFAVSDVIGIDVLFDIFEQEETVDKRSQRVPGLLEKLYRSGRLGEKTGAGWYRYNQDHKPAADSEVLAWIESSAAECGIQRRDISDKEILDRCIYALINEGAKILEQGYALRPVDIDMVYLHGYGFPAYRGGPMFYADTVGLANLYARVLEFHRMHGSRWEPAPLLRRLAEEGSTFSSFGTIELQKS
jgi:3-hydroxyacyl-CoA dehydrogenase